MNGSERVGIRPIEEPGATIINDRIRELDPDERVAVRVVLEHPARVQHEMGFLIEPVSEVISTEVNETWPCGSEHAEAGEVFAGANPDQRRRFTEISRRVLRIMHQLRIDCGKRHYVVLESRSNAERTFIDLMEMHSGKLNSNFVSLSLPECAS